MSYFLGLDSSTQSLTALVIDTAKGEIVLERSVNFGADLPQFESPSGVLSNPDPLICHSDPLMWVEALDLLLSRVKSEGFDWSTIRGISGAGQQHGSVYLNRRLSEQGSWNVERSLAQQVSPLLSLRTAPMWMDSSTSAQCEEIARAAGGAARVCEISGSIPIERFTGPQIRAVFQRTPEAYTQTKEIHLVSSFLPALLTCSSCPMDLGDAAGMNLLDLKTGDWSPELLAATAPELKARLQTPVASTQIVGKLSEYFCKKYGFAKDVPVVAFTGDNPSSLVGMGATAPGTQLISLGTSDTVFSAMAQPHTDPRGYGHVFGNPAGGFMSLLCFSNGSLARERVAQRFSLSWDEFSRSITEATRPGNQGNFMLPFFAAETTPKLLKAGETLFGDEEFRSWKRPAQAVRAVVEAQALSMRHFSDWIGQRPERLILTGGASRSAGLQQVLADVFQAPVFTLKTANASGLGGALRAAQACEAASWRQLFDTFVGVPAEPAAKPDPEAASAYEQLGSSYVRAVEQRIAEGNRS